MASERPLRVFLDANVIFSGLYNETGTAGQVLTRAASGEFTGIVSTEVIDEVVRNVQRKASHLMAAVVSFLASAPLEFVQDPEPEDSARWFVAGLAEDSHVVASATGAESDYICTGDRRLGERLSNTASEMTAITPAELLDLLRHA